MQRCLSVVMGVVALSGACSKDAARVQPNLASAGVSAGAAADGGGRSAAGTAATNAVAGSLGVAGRVASAGAGGLASPAGGGGGSAQAGAGGAAANGGTAGTAAAGGATALAGAAGTGGSGGRAGRGGSAAGGAGGSAAGSGGASATFMPVYRIPLRIHMALSKLTQADLEPVLAEMNQIWLQQAGLCFEIEVTTDETNRKDGFDFRYTAGQIPDAPSANGLTENAHSIWSIDHPNLGSAPHPVQHPAARTTAHELGHALGLAHENPAPSSDCSSPCYCVTQGGNCDDYLMRSGTKGYFISAPEVDITRKHAAQQTLMDTSGAVCAAPVFML